MSLKAFHFFFIIVSILLSAYFGTWCIENYSDTHAREILVFGIISFISTAALTGYLAWFLKKSKGISYLTIGFFLLTTDTNLARACSVCIGNPASPMVKSANAGVLFLLVVISVVLSAIAGLFLFWAKRSRLLLKEKF